jgi:lipopolysaccharide/colanic/teichoic acid biosynthesis glycosyltransferase
MIGLVIRLINETVSNDSKVSPSFGILTSNAQINGIQSLQPDLPFNIENEKYSEKGSLLQGKLKFFPFWFFITDLSIVLISNFIINFIKYGTFHLGTIQLKLFFLYFSIWLFVSIYFEKFQVNSYPSYKKGILFITKSWLSVFFLTTNILVFLKIYSLSHVLFFGICLLHISLELIAFSIYFLAIGKKNSDKLILQKDEIRKDSHFSIRRTILDSFAFAVCLLVINYLKHNTFELSDRFEGLIIITFGLWFVSGIFTCKFEVRHYTNIYYKISPFIKSFLFHFSLMTALLFTFRLYLSPRVLLLGSIILLLLVELLAIFAKHFYVLAKGKNGDISSYLNIKHIFNRQKAPPIKFRTDLNKSLNLEISTEPLKNYLEQEPALYRFIKRNINLSSIDQRKINVLNTANPFNIQSLENHSLSLFINLHKINDFRYLNRYFIMAHRKIHNNGFIIGHAHSIDTHKEWFNRRFPKYMGKILYPFDFIYRRVFPKLPKIRKLYFYLTKGKNRIISKTEVLGRLCFCGFEIITWGEINNRLYFIAQKLKNPKIDKNPSYSPIIKLPRIGLNGKIIYIRKFRTMYPYAEYLQDTIFDKHKLNSNGKIENDYRITEWGKCFRKLWIDELPQIINFWQGDISLVGVRALSEQYYSLYPNDLKELRTKFKPGLIPPYYVDLPKSFGEIIESERKYLKLKLECHFSTDVKYFFRAIGNILIKHARSQ